MLASGTRRDGGERHREHVTFDEAEIRAAERNLEAALEAPDPVAWVFEYTEDAVFDGGGDHVVQGCAALGDGHGDDTDVVGVDPAASTEGCGGVATVWFEASWVGGPPTAAGSPVEVRGMILWRKES